MAGCGIEPSLPCTLYYYPQSPQHESQSMGHGEAAPSFALPNRTQASRDQSFVHPSVGADLRLARVMELEGHRHMLRHDPWALLPWPSPIRSLFLSRLWRHDAANVPPLLPPAASCKPSGQIFTVLLLSLVRLPIRLVPSIMHVSARPLTLNLLFPVQPLRQSELEAML
jgi:hypothetical protein